MKKSLIKSTVFAFAVLFSSSAISQTKQKLTDAEIASIGVIANQIDIEYAEIAKEKSKDKEVLQFAATMASDHKAIIDKAVALVTKLNVTPKENSTGKQLQADAEKTKKALRAKSGDAFNKAYIENEVAYHKAVISTVESVLIPQATNAELKAFLESLVGPLKAHLAHAEMVHNNGHKMDHSK